MTDAEIALQQDIGGLKLMLQMAIEHGTYLDRNGKFLCRSDAANKALKIQAVLEAAERLAVRDYLEKSDGEAMARIR